MPLDLVLIWKDPIWTDLCWKSLRQEGYWILLLHYFSVLHVLRIFCSPYSLFIYAYYSNNPYPVCQKLGMCFLYCCKITFVNITNRAVSFVHIPLSPHCRQHGSYTTEYSSDYERNPQRWHECLL